jgi:hypothetical protein
MGHIDGGQAFGYPGMSLRDWFAGQALAGSRILLTVEDFHKPIQPARIREVTRICYAAADAMLAQRQKKSK